MLSNNICVASVSSNNIVGATSNTDPNCAQHDANNICTSCYYRYYLNSQKVCVAVSDQCNTFDPSSGNCLTCYGGYILSNGSCVITTTPNTDPNCAQRDANNVCTSCYYRYYLNEQNICVAVSDQCNTFDSTSGKCLSCFGGYTLTKGSCVVSFQSNPAPPSDPNCAVWSDSRCIACVPWTYYDSLLNSCQQVSALCKTYNSINGYCTSCFSGYALTLTGICLLINQ